MTARAKRVLPLILLAVWASGGAAFSQPKTAAIAAPPVADHRGDDARAIGLLRSALTAARTNSYVAQVQTTRWGPSGTTASITRIEHLAPDHTHRIYLAPEDVYGDAVVIHGPQMFSYDVKHDKIVYSSGPIYDIQVTANDNFELLVNNYRPVLGTPETVAGRQTIPCSLVNRHTGERVMRLWVDTETKLVLQKETYHSNGMLGSRVEFEEIRYTHDIAPELFSTPVPAGYSVVQGRKASNPTSDVDGVLKSAGFAAQGPHYLPDGFTIIGADVAMIGNVRTLHLLYSDGVRTLSLFENGASASPDFGPLKPQSTKIDSRDAQYVADGPTTFLSWREEGLMLALVGDLDIKELKAIAASIP